MNNDAESLDLRLKAKRLPASFGSWFAFTLAVVVAVSAIASRFVRGGALEATMVGSLIGGTIAGLGSLIASLPYELRVNPADERACLLRISAFLWRSRLKPRTEPMSLGVGDWVPARWWWYRILRNEVRVSVVDKAIVVNGPRSVVLPLWRKFRGPWNALRDSA